MNDPEEHSAPAAQPDVLGEEARNTGTLEGLTGEGGSDAQSRPGTPRPRGQSDDEARPGRDENQAGFLKDEDKRESP
ncbi:MAG TPA: hypothetical protein VFE82_07910 [Ramlibacter sp.]|jgi:hypothetical protein|uniref:hypothetical protein n=1 Tax=Ramlibacter sp. TaxID=1917967 RepID=UPI002D28F569|nr:hypothetical protein [Ramlibacter sp.]HZY18391.1 hypothetical protein [Ramlibacter sp.]